MNLRRLLGVLGIFTLLSVSIFWPIFVGKVNLNGNLLVSFYPPYDNNLPYKNTGLDQLRIYFPFYKVTLEAFKNFQLPLWNPYAFSGHSHMADFQTAVFYPLNIFAFFLSQVAFWHLLRITPTILASFFTFLLLRNLKLSFVASFFGALIFGFSPFILTWGEEVVMSPHSIVWLPLILFAIEKFLKEKKGNYLVLTAFSTSFSLFGGYIQTAIYLLVFVFSYLVFRLWPFKNNRQSAMMVVASLLLGIALAAVQLLPSGELYFNSARSAITLKEKLFEFLVPSEGLLTFLAPDFFGHPATHNFFRPGVAQYYEGIMFVGVAALVFATYAVFASRSKLRANNKLVMFLAVFGLLALSTTLDLPSSKLFLSLPIPFLSSSIANRVLFIPAFCLAIMAAFGMQLWLSQKAKKIFKIILGFALIYAAIVLFLLASKFFNFSYFEHAKFLSAQNLIVSARNLVIPLLVFGATSILIVIATHYNPLKNFAAVLIILLAFLHIFRFSQKYFSFSEREYIFPKNSILNFIQANQGYYRSWGAGAAFLENNFASQYLIFWPEGFDSLNNRSYSEFSYAMQGNHLSSFVFRADAGLGRGKTKELLESPARRRLIDMVGVRYVIGKLEDSQIIEKHNFKKVFDSPAAEGRLAVFENLQVLPRAVLASNYEGPASIVGTGGLSDEQVREERRKLIPQKLLDSDFDFRNVLILERPSSISPQFAEGTAQIVSYKPQEVIVKTRSDQPKLLFLSDNYYPGWKAKVDGDETEILRANYTFRAVPLVPGEHTVRFYYDSEIFKTGLIISILSIGFLIALSVKSKTLYNFFR